MSAPGSTLILFAFSFVCLLVAAVLILNLAGRELGIRELLPEDERTIDDRDAGISRLLACARPHRLAAGRAAVGSECGRCTR